MTSLLFNDSITPDAFVKRKLECEGKYAIPASRTAMTIRILEGLCEPDPSFPIGKVSSIYFDSRNWTYLGEKRNSDYLKTKVRLRWYGHPESEFKGTGGAFAEIKLRTGSRRSKVRIPVIYTGETLEVMDLHDRELLRIPGALISVGAPIRHTLLPTISVSYFRRRYIERSTRCRIALDYVITSPKSNKHMLPNAMPCKLAYSILEVKGPEAEFPLGLRSLLKLGFRREAFSKYYECYRYSTRTLF